MLLVKIDESKKLNYHSLREHEKVKKNDYLHVGQLDLFDRVVMPLSLYDCEVWSYEIVELIPLKFS